MPSAHVARMPSRIAPFHFLTSMTPVRRVPPKARSAVMPCVGKGMLLKFTSATNVVSSLTMIFAVWSAMKQMKRPMPAATARLRDIGIELKIPSRTGVSESARKMSPSTNTVKSANCQL